jgi:hypothetical protein
MLRALLPLVPVFVLVLPAPAAPPDAFRVEETPDRLTLSARGKKILAYQKAVDPAPPGADPKFARSGFIHPLWSPAGGVVTGTRPPDHVHHLGLWHVWTHATWEGKRVDFWNLKLGEGTVRFAGVVAKSETSNSCGFTVRQEHVAFQGPRGEEVVLTEELTVTARDSKAGWLVDYDYVQKNVSPAPLKLEPYRYGGGLSFRGPLDWNLANSDYLTSTGKHRRDSHEQRVTWVGAWGPVSLPTGTNAPAGVCLLGHPSNLNAPQPIRTWHDQKDGWVFFGYVPCQKEAGVIAPGAEHRARYRVWVFDGPLDAATADKLWRDYSAH